MRRHFIRITVILCVILGLPLEADAAESRAQSEQNSPQSPQIAQVSLDNVRVAFQDSLPAVVNDGRVFVPIRFVQHPQIQGEYSLAEDDGKAYLSIYNHYANITLTIGQGTFRYRQSNGVKETSLSGDLGGVVPYLEGEEPMIPLRPVAEALGIQVKWDNRAKSVILETDEEYRGELDSEEEWAEWMGEYPIDWDDESGKPITEEELKAFIQDNKLLIVDYKIDSKYEAVVLEVRESEASTYSIQRLRNGKLGMENMIISVGEDDEGISVKKSHGYLSVVIYEKAKEHRINSCVISVYDKGETKKLTYAIGDKRGYLLPLSKDVTSGLVNLYGDDGFVYEEIFW